MAYPLAGHLWSGTTLVLAAALALAADRTAADPSGQRGAAAQGAPADIDGFLAPIRRGIAATRVDTRVERDPLANGRTPGTLRAVAPAGGGSTVKTSGRSGRRLTAILMIADNRPVAVLDEAVVSVGDRLPDGARVDAIGNDRVWLVGPNGRRQMLTLTPGRP